MHSFYEVQSLFRFPSFLKITIKNVLDNLEFCLKAIINFFTLSNEREFQESFIHFILLKRLSYENVSQCTFILRFFFLTKFHIINYLLQLKVNLV